MATKTKRSARSKSAISKTRLKPLSTKKTARGKKTTVLAMPYDAKKYAGSVPAFASVAKKIAARAKPGRKVFNDKSLFGALPGMANWALPLLKELRDE